MKMRILLIEDNPQLAEQLAEALVSYHYTVDVATDGQEGWDLIQLVGYDLILLDIVLPKLDGINVCRQLRAQGSTVPILLLTGRSTSEDKIFGLDAGADDYVTKPIGVGELNARIRALLRRGRSVTPPVLEWGKLRLDPSNCKATYEDFALNFTPKEQSLLELFLRHGQRVHSRKAILEHLWSLEGDYPGEDTVKAHIKGLRHKLKAVGAKDLVETVYGVGYRLNTAYLNSPSSLKEEKTSVHKLTDTNTSKRQSINASGQSYHPLLMIVDEDQEFTHRVAVEAKTWGMETAAVTQLEDASELLEQIYPDVLLFDLKLSVSQPNDLNWLTQVSENFPKLPILVSTDRDRTQDRLVIANSKAKGILQRTASPTQIMEAVSYTLQQRDNPERPVILIVDDDQSILSLLHSFFSHQGIQVTTLETPLHFWETLETIRPNLVILDVQMPEVSGVELCKMLRDDLQWNWLPVLFLTATTNSKVIQEMFAAGGDDYASKPIEPEELMTRVQNRLKRVRTLRSHLETDLLTGIDNRQRGTQELDRLLRLSKRSQQPFCLAVLELDDLKQLNHKYGHGIGDRVLCQLGLLLRRELRQEDIVARWGGAAFVVGMYGMKCCEGIEWLAEILEKLRHIEFSSATEDLFRTSFSAGVAEYPQDGDALFSSLYQAAEMALEFAKTAGGDRIFPANWQPLQSAAMPTVVLIHPDFSYAQTIIKALETRGHSYHWIKDGQSALEKLTGKSPSLRTSIVLLADEIPDVCGLEILKNLVHQKITQFSRIIMLATHSENVELAMKWGAFDYVNCPCNGFDLMKHIQKALLVAKY
jgi:diguanylate cyclase (GGDEF)-like protein